MNKWGGFWSHFYLLIFFGESSKNWTKKGHLVQNVTCLIWMICWCFPKAKLLLSVFSADLTVEETILYDANIWILIHKAIQLAWLPFQECRSWLVSKLMKKIVFLSRLKETETQKWKEIVPCSVHCSETRVSEPRPKLFLCHCPQKSRALQQECLDFTFFKAQLFFFKCHCPQKPRALRVFRL